MNKFGIEFYKLYQENQDHNFFIESIVDLGNKKLSVVEFVPVSSILNNCYKIAVEKAKYTMNAGQNSKKRTQKRKVINQFKGIMAETAIHLYLMQKCNFPCDAIHRWDLERDDFTTAKNEYDIKISQYGVDYFIESRSSGSYHTDLKEFMMKYDIIGKYSNQCKNRERKSDMYIRPVFQYTNCNLTKDEYDDAVNDTYSDIKNNQLKLYLVAVVGKDEMYGANGYPKNMGQGGTQYQCIRITDAYDINETVDIYMSDMRGRGVL